MRERHHIHKFTPEQMEQLAANPFTLNVTVYRISYTLEFKNLFLSHYENGETVMNIFRTLGYDPETLGENRIYGFARDLLNKVEAGEPLTEGPAHKPATKPVNTDYNTMPSQQSVASMQRELTYLRQQVEFLKKISQLDTTKKSET